jgi:hypothetical protein
MHIVCRRTFILDLLHWLNHASREVLAFCLVCIFSDLEAIIVPKHLWHTWDFGNVRLITHPSYATTSQKAILNRMAHRASEVGVMLNLKI